MKTALVISGGGAKGSFAVGAIRYLYKTYRDTGWFDIVGGTSTGALIAPIGALLAGPKEIADEALSTIVEMYTSVATGDLLDKRGIVSLIHHRDCLNDTTPLKNLLHKVFKPHWFDWLKDQEAPECYVVYTNFQSGEKVVVSAKDPQVQLPEFLQAMLASASVPVFMKGIMIDGEMCFDGGVRDILPLQHAIDLGAETVLPIFLDPIKMKYSGSRYDKLGKIIQRALAISMDEIARNDYELARLYNIAVIARETILSSVNRRARKRLAGMFATEPFVDLFGHHRRLVQIIEGIRPERCITEDLLSFDPEKMNEWLLWGEERAGKAVTNSPFTVKNGILRRLRRSRRGLSRIAGEYLAA